MNGRHVRMSLWVVVLLLGSGMAWGQNSTGPLEGTLSATADFTDVKSPPLKDSDTWGTTWMMHVNVPNLPGATGISNYAGFLFDLEYDGHEVSSLIVSPGGHHVGIEIPGGGGGTFTSNAIGSVITFPGSQSSIQKVSPIALWIDPGLAIESGINLQNSQIITLMHVSFHAKSTTPANNSDIDIHVSQLGVIRHVPFTQSSQFAHLPASAWVYVTGDIDPALSQIKWASGPGGGVWKHLSVAKDVHLQGSAFWATPIHNGHAASYGIEHVPEPATFGLLAAGVIAIGIGRMRRRGA